jgi:hypothetical protein
MVCKVGGTEPISCAVLCPDANMSAVTAAHKIPQAHRRPEKNAHRRPGEKVRSHRRMVAYRIPN